MDESHHITDTIYASHHPPSPGIPLLLVLLSTVHQQPLALPPNGSLYVILKEQIMYIFSLSNRRADGQYNIAMIN